MRAQTSRATAAHPPRPQSRAERRAETRRELIAATIGCLCEVGYFDTTTTMIAARAKVSRGALQHHFRARNDLFLAVVEQVGQDLATAFDQDRPASAAVRDRVEAICRTYWRVYSSDAYLAQVQIWIGAHNDRSLQRSIEVLARRMLQAQDRLWKSSFAGLGIAPQQLQALRSLTLSSVRGLALRPAFHLRPDDYPREIAVLAAMVAHALTTADAPAPSRRRPRTPADAAVPKRLRR